MAIKYLNITVTNKKATFLTRQGDIVCGNSDYRVRFAFDSEWDGHDAKVARFIWGGHFTDVEFSGNEVDVPVISGATEVKVGVYTEGDGPHTTTSATIPATPSVLCEGGTASLENDKRYLNEAREVLRQVEQTAESAAEEAQDAVAAMMAEVGIVQELGTSVTAVMSQKAVTEHFKKLRDTKNLFTDEILVRGAFFKSDSETAHSNYHYFKNVKLEAGTYRVYPRARFVSNAASGVMIGEYMEAFTVESESTYHITVYATDEGAWKLYKSEHLKEEVLPYGEHELHEALKAPEIVPSQTGIVDCKNLFNNAELVEKHLARLTSDATKVPDWFEQEYDGCHYFKPLILEAGTYTVYPQARVLSNLTTREETEYVTSFTIATRSAVIISVWSKESDWKLFKSEHDASEVEPFGKYKLSDSVLPNGNGNILSGKKWVACGDSFTVAGYTGDEGIPESEYIYQDGVYKGKQITYPYIIGLRNNMNIVNLARGGMTMCNVGGSSENSFSNARYLQIPEDADYITLKFGINDAHQASPLGTIDDETTATFYGAWNVCLRHILTLCPFAKVGIIVTNGSSKTYTDATIAIAKKWGIAYIDEVNDPTVPLLHRVDREGVSAEVKALRLAAFRVSETNGHPNTKAQYFEASFIEAWLRTL